MSPDDIFAAQFWPWPDPAVKRDASGRVLFVNAAFLQLYGGQAQDWHGNAVGGWPAPQGPGQPYRFETRVPGQAGSAEQVYDWIEMTMPDGNAFTLARNVTPFMAPSGPQPGEEMTPPATDYTQEPPAETPPAEMPSTEQPAPDYAAAPQSEPEFAEIETAPTNQAPPLQDTATEAQSAPVIDTPADDTMAPVFEHSAAEDTPAFETAEIEAEAPVAETSPAPSTPPAAAELPPPAKDNSDRAYERRALPLESDSSVLGNNWRDAVIAKAVGAEVAQPQDTSPAPEAAAPQPARAEGEGIRILLAEDNAINALLTRTLLEAEGHTVETVEDGLLAVEAMKTSSYDLIFMDMRMPNMDGLEATRKIRLLPNVPKNLPIVALTANAFDDDRNACFDSGMNDFMTKPVSAEELSEMVTNWMSGDQQAIAS